MTSVKEWVKEKIKNGYIRYFELDKFSQITIIGRGSFGIVNKADLANTGLVALKIICNENSEEEHDEFNDEFVKELKLLYEVGNHPNINRCLGITKDPKYNILVLEYANEGNLKGYLNKNFASLKWNDKIRMALDITDGLKFLHFKEIIHRDLHSKNILVNNGNLIIADFGLSKKLAEVTTDSVGNRYGVVEYIEPQCFKIINYKKDKKSDIYSLGILLWEISSGHRPFSGYPQKLLTDHIKDGNRENPIEGTPLKYQRLYQICWDDDPKLRPDIEEVHEILIHLKIEDAQSPQHNVHNHIDVKSNSKNNEEVHEILIHLKIEDAQSPQHNVHNHIDVKSNSKNNEEVHEILIHLKIEDAQSPQHNVHNHIDVKSNSKNNDNDDLSIPSNYPNPINAVNAPVPKFISLINEIGNIFNEIIELVAGASRHRKQICDILKKQVHAAESAIRSLKEYSEDREDFFNIKNYLHLQDLFDIITRIKKFILEISQMKPLIKYIKTISIAKTFIELCEKFGSCINELFPLTIQI
ncbi:Sps1p [Rhizophagus irregularis DAOM 197198w]|uniref:Sps1p n=1 Tax=Rhizophagus irregularis (strain DAOM 197198w) TaxID=1432141 RepID=A0A015KVL4_RHIIW|nr:Sps1p [Rhizophagus irregularis DAOM 197198w]